MFPEGKIGRLPRIQIGLDHPHWEFVLGVLLHEALETATLQTGTRWTPSPDYANSSASYLFAMNHEQFADVVARAGQFLSGAIPALKKVYDQLEKERKRRAA